MLLTLSPYPDIALEIAARLVTGRAGRDALAPFDEEVIVASGGMSAAISQAVLERMPEGVAGLRLQTLEALARRIVNGGGLFPRVASDAEQRLAMRTAIRGIDDPLFESRGVASMLERTYRDVRDSGISLGDLAKRLSRVRGLRNAARTRLVVQAWQQYELLISRLRAIDPADLFTEAIRVLRATQALAPQILAGFYDVTGVQLHFIEALRERGNLAACWIPIQGEATGDYAFAAGFTEKLAAGADRSATSPRAEVVSDELLRFDTRLHEIESVCATIGEALKDGSGARTLAITARSFEPYDLQLLARAARTHGFIISAHDEIPLASQRIGRAAIRLLRLRERGFARGEVFELLRDGLRVTTSISIDRADEATRRAGIAGGTSDELRHVKTKALPVADYVALIAELEVMTATIDEAFLALLSSRFRIESDADARASAALDEVAALFRRAAAWRKPLDPAAVVDAIQQLTTQPMRETSDDAALPVVWTGDAMKLRGRGFERVWALRSEDGILPQRRNEDPILPDSDRRLLGVREIGTGEAEERLLFRLILDSASSQVQFTYAGSDGFGRALRPSQFVRGLRTRGIDRVERVPAGTPRLRPLQLLEWAGTGSVFDGYLRHDAIREKVRERATSLSPTQLEDFGECPQKFFLKHILGVRDIDDPDRELQIPHREKGILDHAILERFYRNLTRDEFTAALLHLPRLDPVLAGRLDAMIAESFDEFDVQQPAFNPAIRDIERATTRRILRDFVARDLDELAEQNLFPREFEYRFGTRHRDPDSVDHPEPFVVNARDVAVRIEGTIDRIDRGDGRLRVIDYKSGKAARYKNIEKKIARGIRLQLPLYAMAAAQFFDMKAEQVSGAIKPLVYARNSKHDFTLAETREELLTTLEMFVEAILDGWFPTFPDESDELNSCKYCPVRGSCRTKHDAEERRVTARHADARGLLLAHRGESE